MATARLPRIIPWSSLPCFGRSLAGGQALYRAGDPAEDVYLVSSGLLGVSALSRDGREAVVGLVRAGEIAGEEALHRDAHRFDARAIRPCRLLVFSGDAVRKAAARDPGVASWLVDAMSRRLDVAVRALADRMLADATARVAAGLCGLADGDVGPRLRQEDLARLVGVSRETVNRALGSFVSKGWIEVRAGSYLIRDREALRARSEF